MKSITCLQPGQLAMEIIEKPALIPGHALCKVKRVGVCGTDLHAFEGTQPYFTYPRRLGHELALEFVESAESSVFAAGDIVTLMPYFHCGHCVACTNGKPNCCASLKVFGVHIDGGMSEYIVVPLEHLLPANNLTLDAAALVEPLAIAEHGVKRAGVVAGEYVLVMGAGPIGLGLVAIAIIKGAKVIVFDVNDKRLAFCRSHFAPWLTMNPATEDVQAMLREATDGQMPTVVIDATGNLKAINNSLHYLAHGGRIVLVGLQKNEILMSHPEFHKRETTLMSSRNATMDDFAAVISYLKQGLIRVEQFVTHHLSLDETPDKFEHLLNPAAGVVKAVIKLD